MYQIHSITQRIGFQPSYATAAAASIRWCPLLSTTATCLSLSVWANWGRCVIGSCSTYGRGSAMPVRVVWLMMATFRSYIPSGLSETFALCVYHTTYHIPHYSDLQGHRCKNLVSDIFTTCYYNDIYIKVKLSLCTPWRRKGECRCSSTHINLETRRTWLISLTLQPVYHREKSPIPSEQDA